MSGLVTQNNVAGPIIANERLWLTADGKRVVSEGDPEAASLLAAKGHNVPRAEAERLGLTEAQDTPVSEPEVAPVETETPAIEESPAENSGEAEAEVAPDTVEKRPTPWPTTAKKSTKAKGKK